MRTSGDPVRLSYIGVPYLNSVAVGLYIPGTNSTYLFRSTDFLVIDSILGFCQQSAYLLSAPAGQSTALQSTVLVGVPTGSGSGNWIDNYTQGMSGPPGIIPSVLGTVPGAPVFVHGTGHVIHSPGTTKPQWMAPLTPGNSAT